MSMLNRWHEKRVERLARAIQSARSYDQTIVEHACGSPGCIMGWSDAIWGVRKVMQSGTYRRFFFGDPPPSGTKALHVWERNFTGTSGCDNAGRSGKKAAAFIRKMLSDLKAALAEGG